MRFWSAGAWRWGLTRQAVAAVFENFEALGAWRTCPLPGGLEVGSA